jgi:plasmid stabilization system protein ParE
MIHDFHPEARLEYREAAIFYDSRRPGLANAFILEIEATIARIKEAPDRWPVIEQDVRRCLTHVFPYSILYTIEQNSILIVSVNHLRRRPNHWRNRMSELLDT